MSFFGAQQPILKSREAVKDDQANMAGINFQNNIMSLQAPLERMLNQEGKFASGALGALGRGFPSQSALYDAYRRDLPPDRAVNMEAFNNFTTQAKQAYDTKLAQQIAFQKSRGMSDKELRQQIGSENPDLLSYAYQNQIMQPKVDGALDDFLVGIAAGGTALGASRLFKLSGKPKYPGEKTLKALRDKGLKFKNGRIVRMDKADLQDFFSKDVVKGSKKTGDLDKEMNKKIQDALEKQRKTIRNSSGVGKQALKGGSKRVGNIATNMALKNVGKHFGAKAAAGIAARIAGGLLSWPMAVTIGAAQLAPVVYRHFKDEE